jgi:hypothetical protein
MKEIERKLQEHFKKEADETMFNGIELSDAVKNNIRNMTEDGRRNRRFALPRFWVAGTAALVAAVVIVAGYPLLQQTPVPTPTEQTGITQPPADGGSAGTGLSQLVTTTVATAEEARAAFGSELIVPNTLPGSYSLKEIATTGMPDEPIRDAVFTYADGDRAVTFSASRMETTIPVELFTKTTVRGQDGYVFEQPELVELYWVEDGVHYGIVGNLSAAEALQAAEAAK